MMTPMTADVFKRAEAGQMTPEDGKLLMREIALRQSLIERILPYVPPNAPMDGLILEHAGMIFAALMKSTVPIQMEKRDE